MRARTGEILAMVGSIDYWSESIDGNVNVAVAPRQPGSAFKPFSYLTAFHQGHTAAEPVMDVRTCFDDYPNPPYCPENYDREYWARRSFRTALAQSRNIPAVQVLDMVGVGNVIRTAHAMGINTLNEDLDYYGLSLTLGGGEVWLLDLTYAYGVLANGGVMMGQPAKLPRPGYRQLDPVSILRVEDKDGQVLWQYSQPEARNIVMADGRELSPQEAYLLTHVLADNAARAPVFGANSALRLSRPAAAKTGTTTDWRDVWTVGYTPQIVSGVWVGNNDNTPMTDLSSSRGAGPIWHNVMERIYNEGHAERLLGELVDDFPRPPGFTQVEVCAISGQLPTEHCPRASALFIEGTQPTTYCNVHHVERVNRQSGKLATICTPPELVEERVYEIYPPEAADWVREKGIPQPPTQRDEIYGCGPEGGDVAILEPTLGGHVRGVVPVRGNARSGEFNFYQIEFGQGLNPSSWSQIGGNHYNQVDNGVLEFWDVRGLQRRAVYAKAQRGRAQPERQALHHLCHSRQSAAHGCRGLSLAWTGVPAWRPTSGPTSPPTSVTTCRSTALSSTWITSCWALAWCSPTASSGSCRCRTGSQSATCSRSMRRGPSPTPTAPGRQRRSP
jgi:membrane carboxypeptidase/penicillin-binding protein PbpC